MITAYRICQKRFAKTALDGEGARLLGGRWNSPGTRLVYLAGSISLAQLEMLVHLESDEVLHDRYVVIPISIPESHVTLLPREKWPRGWRAPTAPSGARRIGDEWIRSNSSVCLQVPSVLVPEESNFLLNPAHPAFSEIQIGKARSLVFDRRLA
ncbi:MAG: RES family NAD+ phosphorylase [Prosthecobacter sp.]|nr:RES family NAD+ phosphorylase [Prosthecobacter sp.]